MRAKEGKSFLGSRRGNGDGGIAAPEVAKMKGNA